MGVPSHELHVQVTIALTSIRPLMCYTQFRSAPCSSTCLLLHWLALSVMSSGTLKSHQCPLIPTLLHVSRMSLDVKVRLIVSAGAAQRDEHDAGDDGERVPDAQLHRGGLHLHLRRPGHPGPPQMEGADSPRPQRCSPRLQMLRQKPPAVRLLMSHPHWRRDSLHVCLHEHLLVLRPSQHMLMGLCRSFGPPRGAPRGH